MGIALAAMLAAMLTGAASPPAEGPPPQPLAGVWQTMSTHAPELRPLFDAALAAIPRRAPLAGVFRAERQFLGAGTAHRLILVLADRSRWRVTLVPRGDGGIRASRVEPLPAHP